MFSTEMIQVTFFPTKIIQIEIFPSKIIQLEKFPTFPGVDTLSLTLKYFNLYERIYLNKFYEYKVKTKFKLKLVHE